MIFIDLDDFKYPNKNHVEKLERLNEWSKGNPEPPIKVSMIPTNRCNLKCDACPNSVARKEGRFSRKDEISKKRWMDIVEQGLDLGVKEWRILGGGEPLVRRDVSLSTIYRVKKESVFQDVEMITNGTLFQANDIEKIVKYKTNRILFSIDGPSAATHDSIRGVKGAFSNASASLRHFHKVKNKTGIEKPVIQVNMVLNNRNYNRIVEMLEFVNKFDVEELALHPMREYEEIKEQMQYLKTKESERKVLKEQILEAKDIAKDMNIKLNLDMVNETENYLPREEEDDEINGEQIETDDAKKHVESNVNDFIDSNCFEPFYGLLVNPDGIVGHCVPYGMGIDGLDLKERNIRDIWYGTHFENIRKKMIEHDLTESCKSCGLLDMTEELREELSKYKELDNK